MMCNLALCLTSGAISKEYDYKDLVIMMGRIDGRPFSALVVDKRSGEHLHLPWESVKPLMGHHTP